MKKIRGFFTKVLVILIIIFGLGFTTRVIYDLKETNIKENIVIALKGKPGLYLLNPNTEEIKTFSGTYNKIEKVSLDVNTKIYSSDGNYYFSIFGVYYKDKNKKNRTYLCPIESCQAFWTKDSKYLIRTDGRVVRMFGMFFSTPTVEQVIHIIEPTTKKSKQILLYDTNGKLLQIERIEGYIQ